MGLHSAEDNGHHGDDDIKPLKLFKPGDTLVLEFQPPQSRSEFCYILYVSVVCITFRKCFIKNYKKVSTFVIVSVVIDLSIHPMQWQSICVC